MVHIHVMGASGSGTTSLGRALSEKRDIAHLDTDDFF
jgi:adenylate kinase family enzyme